MRSLVSISNAFFSSNGEMQKISFGVSLMTTAEALSLEEYFSGQTIERYTVAEVIGHLMYCKWFLLKALSDDFDEEYPFAPGLQGFHRGWIKTQEQRQMQLEYIRKIHRILMTEISNVNHEKYAVDIPDWNMNLFEAIHWICQHDIYHLGQIRNMGLGALVEDNVIGNYGRLA